MEVLKTIITVASGLTCGPIQKPETMYNRELKDTAVINKDLKPLENPRAAKPRVTNPRAARTPCTYF